MLLKPALSFLTLLFPMAASQSSLSARALGMNDWIQTRSQHAALYFLPGTATVNTQRDIARRTDQAIKQNLEWLGEESAGDRFKLFFVDSRRTMRRLVGMPAGGWSDARDGSAFFVSDDRTAPALHHETMHLLSWRLWGLPGGMWMSEGVATAAVGKCHGWSIDEAAAAMYRARKLPTIAVMRRRFKTAGIEGAEHYLASASLILYIDREYGRAKVKELWQNRGLANAQQILGVSTLTLESQWRKTVASHRSPASWEVMSRAIDKEGCESSE